MLKVTAEDAEEFVIVTNLDAWCAMEAGKEKKMFHLEQ